MVKLSQLKDIDCWIEVGMKKVRHDPDAGYTAVNQNEI